MCKGLAFPLCPRLIRITGEGGLGHTGGEGPSPEVAQGSQPSALGGMTHGGRILIKEVMISDVDIREIVLNALGEGDGGGDEPDPMVAAEERWEVRRGEE